METPLEQLELVFQKFKEIDVHELEHVIKEKLEGSVKNSYQDLSELIIVFLWKSMVKLYSRTSQDGEFIKTKTVISRVYHLYI